MQLSPKQIRTSRQRGSILVICMVLAGLGTIGAAAFFSLMQAKTQETAEREVALQRRTKLANSRALAREALLRLHLGSTTPLANSQSLTLNDNWGGVEIAPFTSTTLGNPTTIRLHKTGAVPFSAYNQDISLTIKADTTTDSQTLQAKSAHPALMGDLLIFHKSPHTSASPISLDGSLIVHGRTAFLADAYATPGNTFGFRTERAQVRVPTGFPIPLSSPANTQILPDNFTIPPFTTGNKTGHSSFGHHLLVVDNQDTASNSYLHKVKSQPNLVTLSGAVAAAVSNGEYGDFSQASGVVPPGGPYPAPITSVLCQAAEAERMIQAAAYAALTLGTSINFSYTQIPSGSTPFSTWWTDAKTFDGSSPSGVASDLTAGLQQIRSDLTSAMATLGGPNPSVGGWWPPNYPPLSDNLFWMNNNPYLGSTSTSPLWTYGMAGSDGNGNVQLKVGNASLSHVLVRSNVKKLILTGQANNAEATAAASLPPIMIVINADNTPEGCGQSFKLNAVELQGMNGRRIILAIKQNDPLNVVTLVCTGSSAFPAWHSIIELDSVPLNINTSAVSELSIKGGIRTDRSIDVEQGVLHLLPDPAPTTLEPLLSRSAWLEIYDAP